ADGDQRERVRFAHLVRLDPVVDRQRQRLGATRDVPGHHEGDPELAERAAERQDRPREHGAPRERKRDAPEHAPLGATQRPRRLLQLCVHGFEARLRGLDDERDRPDARGQYCGARGEGELEPDRGESAPDRAPVADDDQEIVAEHRGRQDQREDDDRLEHVAPGESLAGQEPGDRDAGEQRQRRGAQRDTQREPDREGVHHASQKSPGSMNPYRFMIGRPSGPLTNWMNARPSSGRGLRRTTAAAWLSGAWRLASITTQSTSGTFATDRATMPASTAPVWRNWSVCRMFSPKTSLGRTASHSPVFFSASAAARP